MIEFKQWAFASLQTEHVLQKHYLYLFEAGGMFKVGIARDVAKRRAGLQRASPLPLRVVMYRGVNKATAVWCEKYAHERLAEFRSHGEWFRCTEAQGREAVVKASKEFHLVVMRRVAKALSERTVGYQCSGLCRDPKCRVCQLRRAGCWLAS